MLDLYSNSVSSCSSIERVLWSMLELDTLDREMMSGEHSPVAQLMLGTGRTNNACQMCSNSSTTSGCGGC